MNISIIDHGADPSAKTLSTEAINRAIATCSEQGGGVVTVPSGRYLTTTVFMKSGVTLYLEAGSHLIACDSLDDYSSFDPEGKKDNWRRGLILFEDVHHAGIVGRGTVDGNDLRDPQGEEQMRGPHAIMIGNSSELVFRDFSIVRAANYAFMVDFTDDVHFEGLTITGGWDGIHVRGNSQKSCERYTIANCDFKTGDDSIAGRYWTDWTITNCRINTSCNGIRLIGPATRLIIHDCLFYGPGRQPHVTQDRYNSLSGILLQPGSWDPTEGVLDEVYISNVSMRNLECALAVYVKEGNETGEIVVDGLSAVGIYEAALSFDSWSESHIKSVVLKNISVRYTEASTVTDPDIPVEKPHVGITKLPAWGLFARRVDNLELRNVDLSIAAEDPRPCYRGVEVGSFSSSQTDCIPV